MSGDPPGENAPGMVGRSNHEARERYPGRDSAMRGLDGRATQRICSAFTCQRRSRRLRWDKRYSKRASLDGVARQETKRSKKPANEHGRDRIPGLCRVIILRIENRAVWPRSERSGARTLQASETRLPRRREGELIRPARTTGERRASLRVADPSSCCRRHSRRPERR